MTAPVPDPTLAEGLALLISCTEIAQDEHGDAGTLMYEPAKRLADALLASDWLREDRARTWADGYTSGHSNAMRRMSDEPNAPTTSNPYRAEATR